MVLLVERVTMDLIDTHCHIDVAEFDPDRAEVLSRCRVAGIRRMIVPAVEAASWGGMLALCRDEAGLYPALGLHPIYIERHQDQDLLRLDKLLSDEKPIAVGEIGLDYYLPGLDPLRQQQFFEAQLKLAEKYGLPVVLHVRKAHEQVIKTLKRIRVKGGTAHAFNGSLQQAEQYLALGFKLGFGGTLTYPHSTKLRRLAKMLPLEAMVLETDAPDMTVAAHRGERNSPEYLIDCLTALAEVREQDPVEIAMQTTANACAVFGLS